MALLSLLVEYAPVFSLINDIAWEQPDMPSPEALTNPLYEQCVVFIGACPVYTVAVLHC